MILGQSDSCDVRVRLTQMTFTASYIFYFDFLPYFNVYPPTGIYLLDYTNITTFISLDPWITTLNIEGWV